jgi:hypothetical protein
MKPLVVAALATAAAVAWSAETPHGMFELYQSNRAAGQPNFITEDFVLLGYVMSMDQELSIAEEKQLLPATKGVVEGLQKALPAKRGDSEEAAFRYLSVVHALLTGENPTSPDAVAAEVKRVRAANGMERSDLMRQTLDYTQFKPRGRYTRSEELARYFTAMRYAGTVLFPVLESQATGVKAEDADRLTSEALVIARLIRQNPTISVKYARIGRDLDLLVGPSEDLGIADLAAIPTKLPIAEARKRLLERARKTHRQPAILSGPVDIGRLEKGVTASDVQTGWRLFPLRYTADAAALQGLIYDRVKRYKGSGKPKSLGTIAGQPVKAFPQAREVLALLGSKQALKELDATDERNYEGYAEAFQKSADVLKRGRDAAADQLRMLQVSLLRAPPGANPEDERRRVQTGLAVWTWMRYNNALYAKQSYTPVAKGIPMFKERNGAWIEPSPVLYGKLADLVMRFRPALQADRVTELAGVFRRCAAIARVEAAGAALTPEQTKFLNDLDLSLMKFTGKADRPIITDVHTEPNSGLVLEEAIAFPTRVEHQLKSGVAHGARFRHVEFKQKMSDRLTDEQWEAILEKEAAK